MSNLLKRPLKLYLDTSIPNFLFVEDADDKRKITEMLFRPEIRSQYEFYISAVVTGEIMRASFEKQQRILGAIDGIAALEFSKEAETLALAYLKALALPKSSYEDAQHVAVATINNLDAVVSWNFKHLVNLRRIKLINLVNEEMGYKHIEIISPQEVINL